MSGFLCNICGREILDEEGINTCLSCGGVVCSDEYDDISGFCAECTKKGPYQGC